MGSAGCPRRFATRFIGRLFIFARFSVEGVEGGRYQGVDRYLNFALWSEVERFAGLNGPSVCTRERDTRGLSLPQRNTLLYTVHWHRSLSNRCTVDVVSMWNRTDCGHFKTKRRVQLSRLPLSGNQRRLAACRRRAEVKRVFWSWGWTRRRILVTPF